MAIGATLVNIFRSITVEPVLFLGMMATMAEYTVVQELVFTKTCMTRLGTDRTDGCGKHSFHNKTMDAIFKEINEMEVLKMRYYLAILYLLAILPCLYVGSWSDIFGRRKPLSIPFIFSVLASISLIAASVFITSYDIIPLVYLAAAFSGISGGSMSFTANCFGYISDVTNELNRTKRIVILEAMLFLGSFCGFNLGSLLLKLFHEQMQYAFLVTLVLYFFALVYIFVFLDESREPKRENWRNAVKCDHLVNVIKTVFKNRDSPEKRPKLLLLILCSMISITAIGVQTSVLFSFLKNLGWNPSLYGLFNGLMNLVNGVSLIIILPLVCKYMSNFFSDTMITIFGFSSKAAGLLLLGLCTSTVEVFLTLIAFTFNEFTMPPIRSMLSKIVGEDEKGKIFAFLSACQNIAQFISSLIFTSLFAATLKSFPGTCFEIVASLQIVALFVVIFIHFKLKENSSEEQRITTENEPNYGGQTM